MIVMTRGRLAGRFGRARRYLVDRAVVVEPARHPAEPTADVLAGNAGGFPATRLVIGAEDRAVMVVRVAPARDALDVVRASFTGRQARGRAARPAGARKDVRVRRVGFLRWPSETGCASSQCYQLVYRRIE